MQGGMRSPTVPEGWNAALGTGAFTSTRASARTYFHRRWTFRSSLGLEPIPGSPDPFELVNAWRLRYTATRSSRIRPEGAAALSRWVAEAWAGGHRGISGGFDRGTFETVIFSGMT